MVKQLSQTQKIVSAQVPTDIWALKKQKTEAPIVLSRAKSAISPEKNSNKEHSPDVFKMIPAEDKELGQYDTNLNFNFAKPARPKSATIKRPAR